MYFQFAGAVVNTNRALESVVEDKYKCSIQTTEQEMLVSLRNLLLKRC